MQESGEMYLETILILESELEFIRAIDIVERMNFSKPSVSRALVKLKNSECIIVDESSHILLTQKGRAIAEKMYERHQILTTMLEKLGVDKKIAAADACKIEHDISDSSFDAIKNYLNKVSDIE